MSDCPLGCGWRMNWSDPLVLRRLMRHAEPLLRTLMRHAREWQLPGRGREQFAAVSPGSGSDVEGDLELLRQWLAGPGRRPTETDRERWAHAAKDGLVPHRRALR